MKSQSENLKTALSPAELRKLFFQEEVKPSNIENVRHVEKQPLTGSARFVVQKTRQLLAQTEFGDRSAERERAI